MGSVGSLQSKASSSRGRSYALMLLIAFGAALLGVMLLNKLRERRICNLLLKRTDQDLRSFQLLFQKEKDRSKELAKSHEDMTAALYLLRTQKMELDRRLLELQSTIDSLRDEQKIISVALQEKQSEIKTLREKEIESGNENPQVVALTKSLKQKEDELEELRRRLESPAAVAANDSSDSDPRGDSKMSEELREQLLESSGGKGGESESMDNNRGGSKSTGFHEIETQKLEDNEGVEERQKQEKLGDEGENAIGREVEGEETKITNEHKEKEIGHSEEIENGRANKIASSEIKMKTETGKYGNTRKIRGKRWRYIAKRRAVDNGWRLISKKMKDSRNRNLNDNRAVGTTHGKFIDGAEEKMKEEHTQDAKENLMEMENKMVQEENLNSENDDTSKEKNGNGDVEDDSIKQNPGEEMEQNDSKSEENQEPERGMDSKEDGKEKEENKEEPEESEESEF